MRVNVKVGRGAGGSGICYVVYDFIRFLNE